MHLFFFSSEEQADLIERPSRGRKVGGWVLVGSTALVTWQGFNRSNLKGAGHQVAILLKGLRKELSAKIEDKEDSGAVTL